MDTQKVTHTRIKSEARLPLWEPQLLWHMESTELRQATSNKQPAVKHLVT